MNCRLCGGAVDAVLELKSTPIANAFTDRPNEGRFFPLELHQCVACSHVQIGHVIPDEELYGLSYKYSTPIEQVTQMEVNALALRTRYPHVKRVLEIGANNGLFLRSLEKRFEYVVGCDPSSTAPGVLPYAFDANSAAMVGEVDMIVANNVFAHINYLGAAFESINEILKPDGVLVFEVQYFPNMVRSGVFDMIYHEHRDYHTLKALSKFLPLHNLFIEDVENIPNHGGSIRVHCTRKGHPRPWGLEPTIDWTAYRQKIAQAIKAIRDSTPNDVIAFGATAKACTLIHQCDIEDRISYCVDSTPEKVGKYIPGTGIKIFEEAILKRSKSARTLFLTAWNYESIVRQRYPESEFVVPFKQPETA